MISFQLAQKRRDFNGSDDAETGIGDGIFELGYAEKPAVFAVFMPVWIRLRKSGVFVYTEPCSGYAILEFSFSEKKGGTEMGGLAATDKLAIR